MKRLIPATIILAFIISICICANIYVNRTCDQTIQDIKSYYNQTITATQLETNWQERKENMALFVNHDFLDKISVYIGQLTVTSNNSSSPEFNIICKNIESNLSLVKAEQKFGLHSLY